MATAGLDSVTILLPPLLLRFLPLSPLHQLSGHLFGVRPNDDPKKAVPGGKDQNEITQLENVHHWCHDEQYVQRLTADHAVGIASEKPVNAHQLTDHCKTAEDDHSHVGLQS